MNKKFYWGQTGWSTPLRWYDGLRYHDLSETLIEAFIETQLEKARRWYRRFNQIWVVTWLALVAVVFGQALIARAFNFDAHFVTPESWTSLDDLRSASSDTFSQSWKTELTDLWLAIPGFFFAALGTLGVIPAIVFLGAWSKDVFYASSSVGVRSWIPWPLLATSIFIPVVQFFLPPIIVMSITKKKSPLRSRIWIWWIVFVSIIFTLVSGVGAFFSFGPFVVTWIATLVFGIGAFVCVWLTKSLLKSIDIELLEIKATK